MATNFVCKLCGNPNPPIFALSSTGKIPLCADDIGKYISTQNFAYQSIFPIAAIGFIDSASDLPMFEQRNEAMNKSDRVIEQWIAIEKDQFQEAVLKLQVLEEKALAVVNAEFQTCIHKLRNLHESIVTQLTVAKNEINQAKYAKTALLGTVTDLIVKASEQPCAVPAFFSESIHDVEKQLSKTVQASVTLPNLDAEELIARFFSKQVETPKPQSSSLDLLQNMLNAAIPQIQKKEVIPPKKTICVDLQTSRNPNFQLCEICHMPLTSTNYAALLEHESCFACFDCIKMRKNTKFQCPKCKGSYSKDTKKFLKVTIPGLIVTRRVKKNEIGKGNVCANCSQMCINKFHQCTSKVLCFECYEREIAANCYGTPALCPTCSKPPTEICEQKYCSLCNKTLNITEVRHWCGDSDFLVCGSCVSTITTFGRCRECWKKLV